MIDFAGDRRLLNDEVRDLRIDFFNNRVKIIKVHGGWNDINFNDFVPFIKINDVVGRVLLSNFSGSNYSKICGNNDLIKIFFKLYNEGYDFIIDAFAIDPEYVKDKFDNNQMNEVNIADFSSIVMYCEGASFCNKITRSSYASGAYHCFPLSFPIDVNKYPQKNFDEGAKKDWFNFFKGVLVQIKDDELKILVKRLLDKRSGEGNRVNALIKYFNFLKKAGYGSSKFPFLR